MNIGKKYSFKKMKLILTAVLIIHIPVNADSNEEYIFPPKFQTPGTFVSDSSLYLPPESHTPIPYFPMKKFPNLPFPYLPPTGTKSPNPFPTPFPIMLSSSGMQHFNDGGPKNDNERDNKTPLSSPRPPFPYNRNNRTENDQQNSNINNEQQMVHKRDMRQLQKPMHFQQPIDRVDVRAPHPFSSEFSTPSPMKQYPTARSMIISSETHRNDNIFDQLKAAGSSQGGHFVAPPGVFISSTTEPAIPILRLSNEMDLDGSFSYEALGADQTHYVQHSHMENQGTEKEEQVVEGSYSYVGDNGQTYTVNYVADSNGFRASGEHLPVAPPIPEIIQRAIQYNLAEEARKPPHLRSWQADEQEREQNDIYDSHRYSLPQPPRNLFTGKTPEAFSRDLSQRINTQNNLEAAASSQVKTVDFINKQQTNINTGTIAPQVTFLASQGAHVPSANAPQQTVSRMFTNEKPMPTLPQLVNYEADDNNKALWRWQYGLNSNNQINNNVNQPSDKNSISRSSGDDIVINFNEMTPEQYTKMLHSDIPTGSMNVVENSARHFDNSPASANQNNYENEKVNPNDNVKYYQNNKVNINEPSLETTQNVYKNQNNYNNNNNSYYQQTYQKENFSRNPELKSLQDQSAASSQQYPQKEQITNSNVNNPRLQEIYNTEQQNTQQEYLKDIVDTHQSQTEINENRFMTPTNNFEDLASYEPRRIKAYTTAKPSFDNKNYITYDDYNKMNTPSYSTQSLIDMEKGSTLLATQAPSTTMSTTSIKFTDFINLENNDNFKPIITKTEEPKQSVSKENTDTDLSNNIFLKNLFKSSTLEPEAVKIGSKVHENTEKQVHKKTSAETKSDKFAKYINIQNKPYNDLKINKKKPIDISEIINYITMKNHFESNKVSKQKNQPQSFEIHRLKNEIYYTADDGGNDAFEKYSQSKSKQSNSFVVPEYSQLGELRGNIKNYKVLQRQNSLSNYDTNHLKRDLAPPPVKSLQSQNLPPLGRAGPSMKSYLPPIYV